MIDPHNRPVLGDDSVRLSAPIEADVEARLSLGSTPEILRMLGFVADASTPYTRAMAEKWIDNQLRAPFAFVIEHDGRVIGALRLHTLNQQDRRATLAIGILDPDILGHGIGPQAMRLILDYGFETLGLNRINLRVIEYNERAIAAYEKLGFQHEGRERQAARVGDVYYDDIIMRLLASEWRGC